MAVVAAIVVAGVVAGVTALVIAVVIAVVVAVVDATVGDMVIISLDDSCAVTAEVEATVGFIVISTAAEETVGDPVRTGRATGTVGFIVSIIVDATVGLMVTAVVVDVSIFSSSFTGATEGAVAVSGDMSGASSETAGKTSSPETAVSSSLSSFCASFLLLLSEALLEALLAPLLAPLPLFFPPADDFEEADAAFEVVPFEEPLLAFVDFADLLLTFVEEDEEAFAADLSLSLFIIFLADVADFFFLASNVGWSSSRDAEEYSTASPSFDLSSSSNPTLVPSFIPLFFPEPDLAIAEAFD